MSPIVLVSLVTLGTCLAGDLISVLVTYKYHEGDFAHQLLSILIVQLSTISAVLWVWMAMASAGLITP